jgi:outer membrane receptor protein involved in Fe transport
MTPISVFAQTRGDPDATSAERSAEIVVTAQKREERLQDVPLSISAVTDAEIERKGALAIEDLQYSVPGLSITQFSPGQQRVQLRGISVSSGLPTVGTYLDEIPLNTESNQSGLDVQLLDLERVEVLRGPQGTLYGQGAMGGTIRYISRKPDLVDTGGEITAEASSIERGGTSGDLRGALNIPLVADRFAIRLAGNYRRYGGWIDNPRLGLKNINRGDSGTLRASALLKATDRLDVSLLYSHQKLDLKSGNFSDANGANNEALTTPVTSRADLANLTATYDFGVATLTSATSYTDRLDALRNDASRSFIPFFELPAPFGFGFPPGTFSSIALDQSAKNKAFTQEVRLASTGGGALTWTVGGMYRDAKASNAIESTLTPNILPLTIVSNSGTFPSNSESWAIFGEVAYSVISQVTATVGGRYFEDRRIQDTTSVVFGNTRVDKGEATFTAFSPRFNLAYRPNDQVNLYANVAKGFRSGGFNLTSVGLGLVTIPPTYDPETLWSYEVGGKVQTANQRLSADISVYRNEWSDVQSLAFAPAPFNTFSFIVNEAKLAGWGVDSQFTFRPSSALTLDLSASYNDMKYRTSTPEHQAGDRADYVPRYTLGASADYRFQVSPSLPAYARIDYQLSDGIEVFLRNSQTSPARADEQNLLNLRAGINLGAFDLSVFARNVLKENGVTYPAFAALFVPARPQPRTIGAAISFGF